MNYNVKVIGSITILTMVIVSVSFFTQKVLFSTSDNLVSYITIIEKSTSDSEWTKAEENLDKVQDEWSDVKVTWAVLIDHQEIDNIDVTLTRMQKFVQSRDTSSALAEASALKRFLSHIPRKESLNIENIF